MSRHALLSAFVAIGITGITTAQYLNCSSIPLCCQQVIDGPTITPAIANATSSLGISDADVVFPVGLYCIPIMDPPAEYILDCESPDRQVCCETTLGSSPNDKIGFGCTLDPPVGK
ncbi:hypothetical protein BJ138DRAFT_1016586 [Hygrophoropsis aurantiaca]|uniref:Uncharacterized protein n=1 Tax=Hygrophoropsis aurantiaca TaxID=72124 RepID=A0ACB7ZZT1_9AGAM|nr:hypothetical protein BJ138DRAFT_1016586 [Hygrophoropsis aurantiaca]